MRHLLCIVFVLAVVVSAFAEETAPECRPYSRTYETGPLKAIVEMDRTKLRLDEDILFRLTVEAPEDYSVEMPKLEEGAEQFRWELENSEAPAFTAEGNMRYGRTLRLEPILIYDKVALGAVTVCFKSRDGKEYSIETEPVELDIEMPPDEYWDALDVVKTASETPVSRLSARIPRWVWGVIAAVCIIAALVMTVIVLRRRKTCAKVIPPRPPQEIALEELRALVAEHLVEQGMLMEFYNRIQDILRRYIEARFSIMAPERTTEEFLNELRNSRDGRIARFDKLLSGFLTHCDMVRFATHVPADDEIQATFNACREFILSTAE